MNENYYVSVVDGSSVALLAGPYTTHEEALSLVDEVTTIANEIDRKSVFYAFGTSKWASDKPGLLNKLGRI